MATALTEVGTQRLEAFSDGVFAIVITLLVLELRVPVLPEPRTSADIFHAVVAVWPKVIAFVSSFLVVGIYWVSHHNTFRLIRRTDRPLLWLNLALLLCVTFVPFPTALMGEYGLDRTPVILYGSTLVLIGLVLSALWKYVVSHDLTGPVNPEFVRYVHRRNLTPPLVYSAAVLAAFIDTRISIALYALVPVLYILPSKRIDPHIDRGGVAPT